MAVGSARKGREIVKVLDYGLSFIGSRGPANAVRFWVESRTRIIDERNGVTEDYCQCGSCKSEATFAEKDLFQKDNYDFLPIFGPGYSVVFRRKAYLNDNYREIRPSDDWWGGQIYRTKEAAAVQLLEDNAAIRKATHAGLPIVLQTEIWSDDAGLRAIIECPVKTMNINDENDIYQVDTGPVAWPDLSKRYDRTVESLSLAFVAFNAPHFADFAIEVPTPIIEGGREVCRVHHYMRRVSLPAKNNLFCVGELLT